MIAPSPTCGAASKSFPKCCLLQSAADVVVEHEDAMPLTWDARFRDLVMGDIWVKCRENID